MTQRRKQPTPKTFSPLERIERDMSKALEALFPAKSAHYSNRLLFSSAVRHSFVPTERLIERQTLSLLSTQRSSPTTFKPLSEEDARAIVDDIAWSRFGALRTLARSRCRKNPIPRDLESKALAIFARACVEADALVSRHSASSASRAIFDWKLRLGSRIDYLPNDQFHPDGEIAGALPMLAAFFGAEDNGYGSLGYFSSLSRFCAKIGFINADAKQFFQSALENTLLLSGKTPQTKRFANHFSLAHIAAYSIPAVHWPDLLALAPWNAPDAKGKLPIESIASGHACGDLLSRCAFPWVERMIRLNPESFTLSVPLQGSAGGEIDWEHQDRICEDARLGLACDGIRLAISFGAKMSAPGKRKNFFFKNGVFEYSKSPLRISAAESLSLELSLGEAPARANSLRM